MAGAETMAHRMAKFLVQKGHDVTVLCPYVDKEIDGVKVRQISESVSNHYFKNCDVVFTHLGGTADTFNRARYYKKNIIHIVHNSFNSPTVRCRIPNNFLVYNSEWVKKKLDYKQESFTLYPPVDYRDFAKVDTSKAKYVTLVNLNDNKGGGRLIKLAQRLPEVQFMGVEGGYYDQIKEDLPNIKYVSAVSDIRKVLKDTRILIVPSDYESWGQIGIEAASAGIPVIASPAYGLKESLKDGALFADCNDIDSWVNIIKGLEDPKEYAVWSKKAKARAIELDPVPQLEAFEQWTAKVAKTAYV